MSGFKKREISMLLKGENVISKTKRGFLSKTKHFEKEAWTIRINMGKCI